MSNSVGNVIYIKDAEKKNYFSGFDIIAAMLKPSGQTKC